MSEVIDLDALVPKSRYIKLNGNEFELPAPRMETIIRLADMQKRMAATDTSDTNALNTMTKEVDALLREIVPQLEQTPLTYVQIFKLIEILSEMATPPAVKEMQNKGIKPASPKAAP